MARRPALPRGLWVLVALGLVARLAAIAATTGLGHPPHAYQEYALTAHRLIDCGTVTTPLILDDISQAPSNLLPPLYVGIVAGAYAVFGTESFYATLALQITNALASSIAIIFVFLAAARISGNTAAWIAAVVATVNPTLIGYSGLIWDTNLFVLAVSITLYVTARLSNLTLSGKMIFAFGLLLGGLALLNPALTSSYPFLVLWATRRTHRWRPRSLAIAVCLTIAGWMAAITPWTIRNYVHFKELSYVRGGFNHDLWMGVCPEAETDPAEVYRVWWPMDNRNEQQRIIEMGEHAYLKMYGQKARHAIAEAPARWLRLSAIRAIDFWTGTVFSHKEPEIGGWPSSRIRATVAAFLMIETAVMSFALLLARRSLTRSWWLAAIILVYPLVYYATHIQIRYRAPMEVAVAILLGASLAALLEHSNRDRHAV